MYNVSKVQSVSSCIPICFQKYRFTGRQGSIYWPKSECFQYNLSNLISFIWFSMQQSWPHCVLLRVYNFFSCGEGTQWGKYLECINCGGSDDKLRSSWQITSQVTADTFSGQYFPIRKNWIVTFVLHFTDSYTEPNMSGENFLLVVESSECQCNLQNLKDRL